jgi:O-antigen/teichoic acid export membrane protein
VNQPPVVARASLARGGSLVAPALMLVNVSAYVVTVAAARVLSKDAYGSLVALLGVLLVGCVPGIGMQAVVARTVAAHRSTTGALMRRSLLLGLTATGVAAALSPLIAAFLHTDVLGALLVAVQLAPFAVLSGAMGVLQGSERFAALAVLILAQAASRAAGVVPLLFSGTADDVLLALAVGTFAAAVFAVVMVGAPARGTAFGVREVAHATSGLLALLVMANLDVLLARNVLSGNQSGRYAVGAVLSKAAFWLPQAVAIVVFPRLADPVEGRALLRKSVLLVTILGAVEVIGCALLAKPVLEITFGEQYGSLSPYAWLWVVQGAALSVVQLLVYRAIATHDRTTGVVIGLAAVVEAAVVLVWQPSRPVSVILVAAVVAVATTLVLLARSTAKRDAELPVL